MVYITIDGEGIRTMLLVGVLSIEINIHRCEAQGKAVGANINPEFFSVFLIASKQVEHSLRIRIYRLENGFPSGTTHVEYESPAGESDFRSACQVLNPPKNFR